ncbi:MAG: sugar ABC transporter permease, partial [Comamonadaceae bacterium]
MPAAGDGARGQRFARRHRLSQFQRRRRAGRRRERVPGKRGRVDVPGRPDRVRAVVPRRAPDRQAPRRARNGGPCRAVAERVAGPGRPAAGGRVSAGVRSAGRNPVLARRAGIALLFAAVAFFFIWPVLMQVLGIFRSAAPGTAGEWSAKTLMRVYSSGETYAALKNSLVYAAATTLVGTVCALVFALLATRTRIGLRWMITPVMVLLFAAPNLFYAVSWSLLADPGSGLLNAAVRGVTGTQATLFNAYSWTGLIVVQSLKLTGFCYLMLLGPFQNMNRSYEEASMVCGAGRMQTILRVTIPAMTPAIFGVLIVGIVFGLGTFDIPQILGGLSGISFLSTEIFKAIN